MKTCMIVGTVLFSLTGCGVVDGPPEETTKLALMAAYQTVPGHNTAVTSSIYSCNGWSYRMLFSLEQHQDPASPTGWYAAVGPSSRAVTGAVTDYFGALDVSADVYLQCASGMIPLQAAGAYPSGALYNEVYADYRAAPLSCTLTTVWPASWHLPNPVLPVNLLQYDWQATIRLDSPGGVVYLDVDIAPGFHPASGNGFCSRAWFGGGITEVAKFVPPTPPVYTCTGDFYVDYVEHGVCYVSPPDCTLPGNGPCPPPPDAT